MDRIEGNGRTRRLAQPGAITRAECQCRVSRHNATARSPDPPTPKGGFPPASTIKRARGNLLRIFWLPALTTFDFNSNAIRVVTLEGNPWFVANDVRVVLGLTQHGGALTALDDVEKLVLRRGQTDCHSLFPARQSRGGAVKLALISESGLYKLVMRSDKPQAKPFQDWVTRVVLPAIRKDGGWICPSPGLLYAAL